MKKLSFTQLVLILAIIGVFLLLLFLVNRDNSGSGVIRSLQISSGNTKILLVGSDIPLVVFGAPRLDLRIGQNITYFGDLESYNGEEQVVIDRIVLVR